jgi:nitroimidazol reductase NimA-like FMN-containing flavoprotein (pyridoxamine 5'-phosphate oxidase superfamily)
MVEIPEKYLDLLQKKTTFAHLATIMPDGTPQVTPVWFDYTNGKIRVNSAKGRVKTRISIPSPRNTWERTSIRGLNLTKSGSSLKSSPTRCRPKADRR